MELAIKRIKDFFQANLAEALNLTRVTAPAFVRAGTGLNDDLNGVERPVRFQGKGCAIFTASASMMTQTVKGRRIDEATTLFQRFHDVLTCPTDKEVDLTKIGKLAVLSGVREFPLRVKCASLAWHTLDAALKGEDGVTTE